MVLDIDKYLENGKLGINLGVKCVELILIDRSVG